VMLATESSVVAGLTEVRERTLGLLEPLSDLDLRRQHSPLMSPLVWDLAHVANYEDQWLVRAITGSAPDRPELDDLYDAFKHLRRDRPTLPILGPDAARAYAASVRARALDVLAELDLEAARLTTDAYVHGMVIQHEHQHDETILATLQLMGAPGYRPGGPGPGSAGAVRPGGGAASAGRAVGRSEVLLPGGPFELGTSSAVWALDNERPSVEVDVPPFWLDRTPVTNAAYAEFMADGGYDEPHWWTPEGWAWRQEAGLVSPQFWSPDASLIRFGWEEPLSPDLPLQHVCWYEADAYARWAGKRLPTEVEWEYAASWSPAGIKRRWPWGDADPTPEVADLWLSPASAFGPAAAPAAGANPWGVLGLVGGVWEWTSSDFGAWPGFEAWPYREYSEVFFGASYKVLRGGSWATHPSCMRATFRNWDYPIRRQIFAGFRCARGVQ
jgi:iron(II)-dependent oxidoreductase